MRKKKTFDCIAMKERGERAVYEKIKGMTLAQEIDYWNRRSEEMRRRREAAMAQRR
jgi:hypothetical protein